MTWLTEQKAETPFESFLAHRPELQAGYRAFISALWEEGLVPARILEICRLRVAAIHGCEAEWAIRDASIELADTDLDALRKGDFSSFDNAEQAALTAAERIPYQHHELTDEEVSAIRTALGDGGCVSLLNALALFDANCRLKLVFDVDVETMSLEQPPLKNGALT